jgi:hypothetical protein
VVVAAVVMIMMRRTVRFPGDQPHHPRRDKLSRQQRLEIELRYTPRSSERSRRRSERHGASVLSPYYNNIKSIAVMLNEES